MSKSQWFWAVCAYAAVLFPPVARAQSESYNPFIGRVDRAAWQDTVAPTKSRMEARVYGFLFPGGGQYYLGEYRHGAAVTSQTIAVLGAGSLTLLVNNCTFNFSDAGSCTPHLGVRQLAVGSLLVAAGIWIWTRGAVEAGDHAGKFSPGEIRPSTGRTQQRSSTKKSEATQMADSLGLGTRPERLELPTF